MSAFLVVDVQNDFITGTLATKNGPAGEDGVEVIGPINQVIGIDSSSKQLQVISFLISKTY